MRTLLVIALVTLLTLTCWGQQHYRGEADEMEGLRLMREQKLVQLREKARKIIRARPKSIPGHFLMGYSLHNSEGDLPRAKFHLQKARTLFVKKNSKRPPRSSAWGWYESTLQELDMVNAEMDLYNQQIEAIEDYLKLADAIFHTRPDHIKARFAWPLMKLEREEEAREILKEISKNGQEYTRTMYLNTKGALEMETGHPKASYDAFVQLIREVQFKGWHNSATYYRNAGEAAAGLGRFDESERYFQQATRYFDSYSYSNPWWDLTALYLNQGRFIEAVAALKKTHRWSFRTRPYLAQQSWAANQHITCEALLHLGFTERAAEMAEHFVIRPDRQGGDSVHKDQWESGNLLLYRSALKARIQAVEEAMAWSRGTDWWKLFYEKQDLSVRAKLAGQRAASLAARNERIAKSLRFNYAPGTVMITNWHRPDLVALYGPGVTRAALKKLYESGHENLEFEMSYFTVFEAEAARLQGDRKQAIKLFEQAVEDLPKHELTLKSRARAELAKLYDRQGKTQEADKTYARLLDESPGMFRFFDLELPVEIDYGNNANLKKVARMLHRSPRFDWVNQSGFKVKLTTSGANLEARLTAPSGTVVSRTMVAVEDDADEALAQLAEEIHRVAFAPRLNLSQKDLSSLDGSNLSGTTRSNKLRDDLLQPKRDGPRI